MLKVLSPPHSTLGIKHPVGADLTHQYPTIALSPIMLGPNITGDWRTMLSSREEATTEGAAYFYFNDRNYLTALTAAPNNKGQGDMIFHADRSNAIYGSSSTVQPTALNVQYLIKY